MKKQPFSILQNIQDIIEILKDSKQNKSAYFANAKLDKLICQLGSAMERSENSALHFAVAFHLSVDDDTFQLKEIAAFLKLSLSEYSLLIKELKILVEEGFLVKEENYNGKQEFSITQEVREAVFLDKIPQPIELKTDIYGLSEMASKCLQKIDEKSRFYSEGMKQLEKMVASNPEIPVCKWILENKISGPDMIICMYVFARSMTGYTVHGLRELIGIATTSHKDRILLRKCFIKGDTPIIRKGIIKWEGQDIQSTDTLELTEAGKEICLGEDAEIILGDEKPISSKGLLTPEKIKTKNLYYNERERYEVNRIEDMLMPIRFEEVCRNYSERNMPSGICILFYGSAGTGKTESVLQLAKKTGRAIRQVDMSSIKDKWVGESEKNVKTIFDEYRYACNNAQAKPILLLNEADAIITKRISVERTVDQMSNAIQNIFLEEMEKFDGILIATSNLQNNFDPAFDRRFLFKVEFDKPSEEIRAQIIMDRIPTISINDAKYLAMKYELSGGQVENVARKAVTELLLSGKNPDCNMIEKFCNEEKGFRESGTPRGKIGFVHPIAK